MTANLYANDTGAINESFSDVMGNIIEMRLDGDAGAWTIAEGMGEIGRNMADPHECAQPEFAFDTYYAPHPPVATGINDMGGVHINSSLLNKLSYRLDQAGMSPKDQFALWLSIALTMTPHTDYPQMAELLPWCMAQSGYDKFVEPLKKAIADAKYTLTEVPSEPIEGCGIVTFDVKDQKLVQDGTVALAMVRAEGKGEVDCWPPIGSTVVTMNVPAGDYYAVLSLGGDESDGMTKYVCQGQDANRSWVLLDNNNEDLLTEPNIVHVEAGKTIQLPEHSN
jgi:hypothetical protein